MSDSDSEIFWELSVQIEQALKLRRGEIRPWDFIINNLTYNPTLGEADIACVVMEIQYVICLDDDALPVASQSKMVSDEYIRGLSESNARLLFRTAVILSQLDFAERVRHLRGMDVNAQTYRCPKTNEARDSNILEDSIRNVAYPAVGYLLEVGADGNIFEALARSFVHISEDWRKHHLFMNLCVVLDKRGVDLNAPLVEGLSNAELFTCNERTAKIIYRDLVNERVTFHFREPSGPRADIISAAFSTDTVERCFSALVFIIMRTGQRVETGNMPPSTRDALDGLQQTVMEALPAEITRMVSGYLF